MTTKSPSRRRGARPCRGAPSARAAPRARRRSPRRRARARGLADLEALVVAERGRRAHADLERERQRLALVGQVAEVEVGIADGRDARVVDRVEYQRPSESRTVSSRTASRPTRWMTIGGGTLPRAEPGHAQLAAERLGRLLRCAARSPPAATSASTRTRDSGSSVTVVFMRASDDSVGRVGSRRRTFAAWLFTGPVGHLVAGVADWVTLLMRYWWARLRGRPIE